MRILVATLNGGQAKVKVSLPWRDAGLSHNVPLLAGGTGRQAFERVTNLLHCADWRRLFSGGI